MKALLAELLKAMRSCKTDLQQHVRRVVDEHHQRSYADVVDAPRERQEHQRGQVVDDLLLKVLRMSERHTQSSVFHFQFFF